MIQAMRCPPVLSHHERGDAEWRRLSLDGPGMPCRPSMSSPGGDRGRQGDLRDVATVGPGDRVARMAYRSIRKDPIRDVLVFVPNILVGPWPCPYPAAISHSLEPSKELH